MARRGGGRIVKEGYLTKSPPQDKAIAQWRRRYFVLWSTRLMEYYSSYLKKPQDYLKTIDLENCEDMIAPFDTQNKLHVIKLCIKTGNKMRDYLFQCESEADLNSWVEDFATVCGFTSVDEDEEEQYESPVTLSYPTEERPPLAPPSADPRRPLPSRPSPDQPRTRLPPPIPTTARPDERARQQFAADVIAEPYEDPSVVMSATYECLGSEENGCEPPQEQYEDLTFDEGSMMKNPPPVWRADRATPPPLPRGRTPPRRWTKSLERGISPDFSSQTTSASKNIQKRPLPQIPPEDVPANVRGLRSSAPVLLPPKSKSGSDLNDNKSQSRSYEADPPIKSKPLPSRSKPAPISSPPVSRRAPPPSGSSGGGPPLGFNLKNDPKFGKKLQEKREELYGASEAVQHSREGNQAPSNDENYDEIGFVGEDPQAASKLPVVMQENHEGYIDVMRPDHYSLQFDPDDPPPQLLPKTKTLMKEIDRDVHHNRLPNSQKHSKGTSPPAKQIEPFTHSRSVRSTSRESHSHRSNASRGPVKQRSMSPEMWRTSEQSLSPTTPPPLPSREVITTAPVINETASGRWDRPPPPVLSVPGSDEDRGEPPPPPLPRRNLDKSRSVNSSSSSLRSPSPDNSLPLPPRMLTPVDDSGCLIPVSRTSPTLSYDGPPVPSRLRRTPEPEEEEGDVPPTPPARSISHDGSSAVSQRDFSRFNSTPAPPPTQPKPKAKRVVPTPPKPKPKVRVQEASLSKVFENDNEDIFEEIEFGKPPMPQVNVIKELNRDMLAKKQHTSAGNPSTVPDAVKPHSRVGMPSPPMARKPAKPRKPAVATPPQSNLSSTPPAPRPHRITPKITASKSVDLAGPPPPPPSSRPKSRPPPLPASKPPTPTAAGKRPPVLPRPPAEVPPESTYSLAMEVAPRPLVKPKPKPVVPPKK